MELLKVIMYENFKNFFICSEDEKIILYKKYLTLESSVHSCKIKVSNHSIITNLKNAVIFVLYKLTSDGSVMQYIHSVWSLVLVEKYLVNM